jgi:hypothetical protein
MLTGLRKLRLTGDFNSGDSTRALADGPLAGGLEELVLGGFSHREAEALAAGSRLTRLRVLRLANCSVGSPGLRALAASGQWQSLQTLDLTYNGVDDGGAKALAGSRSLQQLRRLLLARNKFSERGLRALAASPLAAGLRVLEFAGNGVSCERFHELSAAFPRLIRTDM